MSLRSRLSWVPLQIRIFIALVVLSLGATALCGAWAYRSSTRAVEREAMRSVGILADARRQTLRAILDRQQMRAQEFLSSAGLASCGSSACLRGQLEVLARSERADDAVLQRGTRTVFVGRPEGHTEMQAAAETPAPPITLAIDEAGRRYETIRAQSDSTSLAMRLPLDPIDALFLDRRGLGASGEAFLADARGMFLTPSRHAEHAPGHFGLSHPIDSRPMQACLAGVDGEMRAPDYRGEDVIHGFRGLPELGGACIMAHVESSEVFAAARRLRWHIVAAIGVLGFLAVIASRLMATAITRPISRLSAAAEVLGRGRFDCSVRAAPAVDVGGPPEIRAFAGIFSSMSRAIMESRCDLEQAVRAREDLLAIVSHDLKNPVAAITLQTGLLRRAAARGGAVPDIDVKLERIGRTAERMKCLITDLQDAASIERGTLSVDVQPHDCSAILRESIESMQPIAAEKGVTLRPELAVALPAILCDECRILQVLGNLVGNAIKFSPAGSTVVVRARVVDAKLEISVIDEGPGIAADALPNLFSPYWHTARKSGGGTGLGLYIAKGILDAHRAALRVESAPGKGSRFFFDLSVQPG